MARQPMRPRCPSVGPEGYRCRKRVHGAVPAYPLPDLRDCHVSYGWQGSCYWDDESASERPVQVVSYGDGEIVWSVARLEEAAAPRPVQDLPVRDHVDPAQVNMEYGYWRTVDVHTPVVLVPSPSTGWPVVVDGRHRLYKAWRQGRETVPSVTLTHEEEQACRLSDAEIAEMDLGDDRRAG